MYVETELGACINAYTYDFLTLVPYHSFFTFVMCILDIVSWSNDIHASIMRCWKLSSYHEQYGAGSRAWYPFHQKTKK